MGLHDRIKGGEPEAHAAGTVPSRPRGCRGLRSRGAAGAGRLGPVRGAEDPDPPRVHREARAAALHADRATGDLSERVLREVTEQLALDRTPLTREERRQLVREITDDILGYGPLEPLLRDDSVTEVMVNDFDRIYIERDGKIERTKSTFADNAHLLRIIDKIVSQVGRRIDEASPMVDARLPDGSRVNAIIPPLALKGPTLTIRKFARDPYTMDDLIKFGSLSPKAASSSPPASRGS